MTLHILIPILISGLIVLMGLIIWNRLRRKSLISKQTPYLEALYLLLDCRYDEALERLKQTVKSDTDNIMAYILLGNVFRKNGNPSQAAKVHRNLLVRGDLNQSDIKKVLKHLVLDFHEAGSTDRAIETAERLIQLNKKDIEIKKLLLSLYEEKKMWDKAFFYRQDINKWIKKKDQQMLAYYKVQAGIELVRKGQEHEARVRFREAIKLDKKCFPAYLNWGDSYRREKRIEDALHIWLEFTQKNPKSAHLVFDRLKEVLFDLGRYGDLEQIYQQVIRKKPKDPTSYLNQIEIYKKQGKIDQALNLCEQLIESKPLCHVCRFAHAKLQEQKGKEQDALIEAFTILDQLLIKDLTYHCQYCEHESSEPIWYCPNCHQFNTIGNS